MKFLLSGSKNVIKIVKEHRAQRHFLAAKLICHLSL